MVCFAKQFVYFSVTNAQYFFRHCYWRRKSGCFGVSTKSIFIPFDTLSKTPKPSSHFHISFQIPTLSSTRGLGTILMGTERGTETYLSSPAIKNLAPDGRPLPTPPVGLPSTGKWADFTLLGRSTSVNLPGCTENFYFGIAFFLLSTSPNNPGHKLPLMGTLISEAISLGFIR
jgi:hypothetical protein